MVLQIHDHALGCLQGEVRVVIQPTAEVYTHSFVQRERFVRVVASEKNGFATSFSKCDCFSCGDPAGAAVFVVWCCFDVGFDCVVEDRRRFLSRYVVVVD